MKKDDRLGNLRSLTLAKNNIEKNVKKLVLFKNYKERFERSLHLWFSQTIVGEITQIYRPLNHRLDLGSIHFAGEMAKALVLSPVTRPSQILSWFFNY